jgi:tRNA pseudouridine55 synthase
VHVHAWELASYDGGVLQATITCGGGTYIRALARDLGRACGSAAHLSALRRTSIGPFTLAKATPVRDLSVDKLDLLPPLGVLSPMPHEYLGEEAARMVARGMRVPATSGGDRAALVGAGDTLVAIAVREGDAWQPRVVLADD